MNYLLKIDVTKIEKARLFKGAKGTYLDCIMIESKGSQYGDTHMIAQSVSKEEREKGVRGPIIGNAKEMGARPAASSATPPPAPKAQENLDEDVPF